MKKKMIRFGAFLASAMLAVSTPMMALAEKGYTYNYDHFDDVQYSPDMYETVGVYTSVELGIEGKLKNPEGLFVQGNKFWIADSGNNRILEFERTTESDVKLVREFSEIKSNNADTVLELNKPTDISVNVDGDMFIADQGNGRIIRIDKDLNLKLEFLKPDDNSIDKDATFLPNKIAIDTAGRVYCAATNINKGLLKYENDGKFSSFVGATKVTYEFWDYIWKRIGTKEQRAKMASFVPTEYDNIFMDYEGFIYAVTSNVKKEDLRSGSAQPVRRLNMLGDDILIRNGDQKVIGDIYMGSAAGYDGPSLFTDVTALSNDSYVCLDKVRGRLFGYDEQGRILFVFGGSGNQDGYFKKPVAIESMGRDLLVLDGLDSSVTIFKPTVFGNTVYDAIEQFQDGLYEESNESWHKVMEMNGNYDLAYIGIGRALLRQQKYEEALEYFELKWDGENYSRAFKQYRKIWVQEHIVLVFGTVFLILFLPLVIGRIKAIKREIKMADIFRED